MPHIVVKMWSGESEQVKARMADAITQAVMASAGFGEESVSVGIEAFSPAEWMEKVYRPDIVNGRGRLYKKPGYQSV